jgi:hypothetical protein
MLLAAAILSTGAFAAAVLHRFNRDLAEEKQFRAQLRRGDPQPISTLQFAARPSLSRQL